MASGFQGTAYWNCMKLNKIFSDIIQFVTGKIKKKDYHSIGLDSIDY